MWGNNVYYNPESVGVTTLGEISLDDEPYMFSLILVVQDNESGKIFAAHDAGCSCPAPFEDHKYPTDFVEIHYASDIQRLVEQHQYDWGNVDKEAVSNMKRLVREKLYND